MSTFHGLEMAKQAMFAQRSALYTTGHNISNANTEGYSRQRVNFQTAPPFPPASRNRPGIPGQMGTGVETGTVERIRNKFLDLQFRAENSKTGFWESKSNALNRLERLMNEPSESGLSKTMSQFWESLQDLSVNPDNSGARSVVAERGMALADSFNYTSDSLESIRTDLKNEIDVTVKNANSLLRQINGINEQVKQIEPHGYLANDLYDERDRLIDELSSIVNIKVTYSESGDSSPDIADGLATIELADSKGKAYGDDGNSRAILLNGDTGEIKELEVEYSEDDYNAVTSISIRDPEDADDEGNQTFPITEFFSNGSLKGNIEAYGYTADDGSVKGFYTDTLTELDRMVEAFVERFNEVHGNIGETDESFFQIAEDDNAAATITVNQDIMDDPGLIVASEDGYGDKASDLADVFDEELTALDDTSVNKFFESLIGDLGVIAQEANTMKDNVGILRSQVEDQRMSVSSVSLDEEMSNMIKFQHAYNAAARNMTAVDEMIDRIINNMGLVGR